MERGPIRSTIKEMVYQWILLGTVHAGQTIKISRTAAQLGVSETPVREALIELDAEGLVNTDPGRGFVVRPLSTREVTELYPLIWLLECEALRSAPVFSVEEIAELEAVNRAMMRDPRPEDGVVADNRWHDLLLQGLDNRTMKETLKTLKRRAFRYEYKYLEATGGKISTQQHVEIIRGLRANQREHAVTALKANWQSGPEYLVPWIESLDN